MTLNKNEIIAILEGQGTYKEKYLKLYGESVTRDKARHAIEKLQRSIMLQDDITISLDRINETTKQINETLINQAKININSDGTQSSEKLVSCSEEELKDPQFLLAMHGYDVEKFELVSARSSMWQNGANGGNKTLYSSRITVKPVSEETDLKDFIDDMMSRYSHAAINVVDVDINCDCEQMLEICIPDLHIGLSEAEEGEYSIDNMESLVYRKISKINSIIHLSDVSNVTLAFLGDIFHYDNISKTTSKGTPQCSNVSFQTAFDSATRLVISIIGNILMTLKTRNTYPKLNIVYVPGNHDTILGYAIMAVAAAKFSNEDGVAFDIKQKSRKFIKFGKNLIGFAHGDIDKRKLSQWLYTEAREYISSVDQIEVHCGHLHSEQVTEDNGVIVRHLPTICGVSPWEYQKGYHSQRRLTAFKWSENQGLQEIIFI